MATNETNGGTADFEVCPAGTLARLAVLEDVAREGRRAIGDHFAPNDCYATGPMTGDAIRDLVQCPACTFIAMHDAALNKAVRS